MKSNTPSTTSHSQLSVSLEHTLVYTVLWRQRRISKAGSRMRSRYLQCLRMAEDGWQNERRSAAKDRQRIWRQSSGSSLVAWSVNGGWMGPTWQKDSCCRQHSMLALSYVVFPRSCAAPRALCKPYCRPTNTQKNSHNFQNKPMLHT